MKRVAMMSCVIVAALLLINVPARAQFGIYGGVAFPMGDFGSTDANEKSGGAIMGFGGGLEYNWSIPTLPLGLVTSVSGVYNDLDTKKLAAGYTNFEYTPWITVWPMTGARVSVPAFPLYAQLQIGLVIAMYPEFSGTYGGVKYEQKADPSSAIGFSLGAGANLGPLNISARYMSGEPEWEYKEGTTSVKFKKPISLVLLTVGLQF